MATVMSAFYKVILYIRTAIVLADNEEFRVIGHHIYILQHV